MQLAACTSTAAAATSSRCCWPAEAAAPDAGAGTAPPGAPPPGAAPPGAPPGMPPGMPGVACDPGNPGTPQGTHACPQDAAAGAPEPPNPPTTPVPGKPVCGTPGIDAPAMLADPPAAIAAAKSGVHVTPAGATDGTAAPPSAGASDLTTSCFTAPSETPAPLEALASQAAQAAAGTPGPTSPAESVGTEPSAAAGPVESSETPKPPSAPTPLGVAELAPASPGATRSADESSVLGRWKPLPSCGDSPGAALGLRSTASCLSACRSAGASSPAMSRTLCRNSCRLSLTSRFCSFWTRSSSRSHLSAGICGHKQGCGRE